MRKCKLYSDVDSFTKKHFCAVLFSVAVLQIVPCADDILKISPVHCRNTKNVRPVVGGELKCASVETRLYT